MSEMAEMNGMSEMVEMNEMSEMAGMTGVTGVSEMDKMNRDGLISHIDFLVRLCSYDTAHAEPLSTAIIYGDALLHASYCPCWHP